MTNKTTSATQIFNFLRGAVRSAWGVEDFRKKRIAIIGMTTLGQELLAMLCFDDVELFFSDDSLVNYSRAHIVCDSVDVVEGDTDNIDITISLHEDFVEISRDLFSRKFPISSIGDDPYNQGIHAFYLQK